MLKLVVGCGYLGYPAALRWRDAGHEVVVVTRSLERARALESAGLRPLVRDITHQPRQGTDKWPRADTMLFAIGRDRQAEYSLRDLYVDGLRRVLQELPRTIGRVIYISSTGVYGQFEGELVDETAECCPVREGGRACLEAERLLLAHELGARTTILRLAGLYGPGRIPRRREIEAGTPIASSDGYLNLIHVHDAVSAVMAADRRPDPARVYNVADGNPVDRQEYYRELARLLDAPPPRFRPPAPDAPTALRSLSNKRIQVGRMRQDLAFDLRYPSYREGLRACLCDEKQSQ